MNKQARESWIIVIRLLFTEELLATFNVWLDRILARLPASWADLAMLVDKLKCLDQSQNLVDTSAHWQVVDGDLTDVVLLVNDE